MTDRTGREGVKPREKDPSNAGAGYDCTDQKRNELRGSNRRYSKRATAEQNDEAYCQLGANCVCVCVCV